MKLAPEERARVRKQFTAALYNLSQLSVYYFRREMRLVVRSETATKRHAVPPDAVLIGIYSHPFGADDFLGDLDDMLVRLHLEEQRRYGGPPQTLSYA